MRAVSLTLLVAAHRVFSFMLREMMKVVGRTRTVSVSFCFISGKTGLSYDASVLTRLTSFVYPHWAQVGSRRAVEGCGYGTGRAGERRRAEEVSKRKVLLLAIESHRRVRAYRLV